MIKKGVTGFNCGEFPNLGNEIEKFITIISNTGLFKITNVEEDSESNNYYRVKVIDIVANFKFDIVINTSFGYYTGVSHESKWMNLTFIDLPKKFQNLNEMGLTYLSSKYLNSKLDYMDIRELSPDERKEVSFWKAETKGEVIFNGYD